MDEPQNGQHAEEHVERDADEPLSRDDSTWFARQLGDEWRPDEPGIYRYVGPSRSEEEHGDVVAHGGANGRSDDESPHRRWVPWRKD